MKAYNSVRHFLGRLLLSLWCVLATASALRAAEPEFQAGVNVILRSEHYESLDELPWKLDELFAQLKGNNIDSVLLNWLLHTDGVRDSQVYRGPKTASDEAVEITIAKAKAWGFRVGLRPILDEESIVADGQYEWRGTIRPRDVHAWFHSYQELLVTYATLAEAQQVDFIVLGVELTSMEVHEAQWRDLIASVRSVFTGELTYSSNQLISKTFPWDALDFISVDAFLELDSPRTATAAEVEQAWQKWVPQLMDEAKQIGLPLLFSEIGATSQEGAHRRSWVWDHNTPVSLENQQIFYQAACAVWRDRLTGMYWWAVEANPWAISEPLNDASFSPMGKPAEKEIALCYE